jgi:uncharacterized protein DUF4132
MTENHAPFPEPDWPAHEALAGDLAASLVVQREPHPFGYAAPRPATEGERAAAREAWQALQARQAEHHAAHAAAVEAARAAPPEVLPSLLLLMMRRATDHEASGQTGDAHQLAWQLRELSRRRYRMQAADAAYALRVATVWSMLLAAASAMARRAEPAGSPDLIRAVQQAADSVRQCQYLYASHRNEIMRNLTPLLPSAPLDGPVITSAVVAGDGWSTAVLTELATWTGAAASVNLMLDHLTRPSGSKPTDSWLARAGKLAEDPETRRLLRLLVQTVATAEPAAWQSENLVLVSASNAGLLRAACWAASGIEEPWVIPALRAAGSRTIQINEHGGGESDKVPNACIHGLGIIATADAVASLHQLRRGTRHAGFRARIDTALAAAARNAGISPSALAERVVRDAGLGQAGRRLVQVDAASALISLGRDLKVTTEWESATGRARTAPEGLSADAGATVKRAAQEVRTVVAGERQRLEELLACERSWQLDDWHQLYLDHPVTGAVTRGLIWTFDTDDGRLTGLPDAGMLTTLDGPWQLPAEGLVRLWHPIRATTQEVRAWRDCIVRAELRQPFKQAFREIYPLTPAELETRLYSNRFAAHVLNYRQAYALFKQRGWTASFLRREGEYGAARREFPDAGLTAVFDHYTADPATGFTGAALCGTDRVFFHRIGDRTRTFVPLQEVPELVFSEAMRDVDLFIAVSSIALDPQWADRGEDPRFGYWYEVSFGTLGQTAVIRREALACLLPRLKIASRLELTDRFLRVRGQLSTYKIHLGSANILIEPDDRYLCIVPRTSRTPVMLPFDEDQVLSLILSKAVLLAADDKITDGTILAQLPARP